MEFEIKNLKNELHELNRELIRLSTYNLIGLEINHTKFGIGKIYAQNGFVLSIKFSDKDRNLQFPFVFLNNIIECNNKDILAKMEEISKLQNKISNIENEIERIERELIIKKKSVYNVDSNPNLFAVTTGTSFNDVVSMNIYYCKANRCRKICDYLGLYNNKSIIKIGKIKKIIEAEKVNDKLITDLVYGEEITKEDIELINKSIKRGCELFNCDIGNERHKYFIVDKFYDTDYRKASSGGLMEHKYLDLYNRLGLENMPNIEELAEALKEIEWE